MRTYGQILAAGALGAALIVPSGAAPGAPDSTGNFLPADKSGFGTATGTASTVWFTVQKEGGLGEVYYPDLSTPAARALQFVVADRHGHAVRPARVDTVQVDERSLTYRQTFTGSRWRLTVTYVTDPGRPTVLADVDFDGGDGYDVWAVYDPALSNSRTDDTGRTVGDALVATDSASASALVASPRLTAMSTNANGDVVQTARLARRTTLALAFGREAGGALAAARTSLRRGFGAVKAAYADGWHTYLGGLKRPPVHESLYLTSAMVLAASEDKVHRGAFVAAPNMPWIWGTQEPSGPYHLVWSRDLYQIATALIAAGDTAGANRALDFLFTVQQKPDGSFPQNSRVDGVPVWTGLQLDEVAFPIVLAYQLGRTDAWPHVKRAADFIVNFQQDGNKAPWTPQERWENQSGYSPATIASEIAGLVCAAVLARANGDAASAARYEATADDWQARVKGWTVTTNGPYSAGPYFLRLTKDGNPNAGTTYSIGDSGPSNVDQRRVVDPSFLDLVRLGVLPAKDPAVTNSLGVIDAQLGVPTARGFYWHRASFDGYGEKRNGDPWEFPLPPDSRITLGRAWPLLSGERGEYQIAAGQVAAAWSRLAAMTRAAGPGGMLPEQVWDNQPPAGTDGFVPGTPTFSATPLAWTHAQYVRLAWDLAAGKVLEQPAAVAARYVR